MKNDYPSGDAWKNAYHKMLLQLNRADPVDNMLIRLLDLSPEKRPSPEEAYKVLKNYLAIPS
jgi:hypothetical protein